MAVNLCCFKSLQQFLNRRDWRAWRPGLSAIHDQMFQTSQKSGDRARRGNPCKRLTPVSRAPRCVERRE
ncbi:hypothetical protein TNCV_1410241 [Trichonephila clavipes]|nr:hypothetical protein TNCV_1410241 [Trichonephila clavipes]